MDRRLIAAAKERDFVLGKCYGGRADGATLWVLPDGPLRTVPSRVTVRGTNYRPDGPERLSAPLVTGIRFYRFVPDN